MLRVPPATHAGSGGVSDRGARARARAAVSDHAVLRYLERVHGVDVDAIRLAVHAICADGIERGASAVRVDGRAYVIRLGVVVTVYPKGSWIENYERIGG